MLFAVSVNAVRKLKMSRLKLKFNIRTRLILGFAALGLILAIATGFTVIPGAVHFQNIQPDYRSAGSYIRSEFSAGQRH